MRSPARVELSITAKVSVELLRFIRFKGSLKSKSNVGSTELRFEASGSLYKCLKKRKLTHLPGLSAGFGTHHAEDSSNEKVSNTSDDIPPLMTTL